MANDFRCVQGALSDLVGASGRRSRVQMIVEDEAVESEPVDAGRPGAAGTDAVVEWEDDLAATAGTGAKGEIKGAQHLLVA